MRCGPGLLAHHLPALHHDRQLGLLVVIWGVVMVVAKMMANVVGDDDARVDEVARYGEMKICTCR